MIPPKFNPPLPMRFWRGKVQYQIRASGCGRYIGSRDGADVAISSDPALLMRMLLDGPTAGAMAPHRERDTMAAAGLSLPKD